MDDLVLFPLPVGWTPPEPPEKEKVSADTRRNRRYLALLVKGVHPISKRKLHPDAAPPDRDSPGLRCGSCVHHISIAPYNSRRTFPKCDANNGAYITGTITTDCRAWYPACALYEPKETL